MKRLTFVPSEVFQYQRFSSDCGFACLKMLCNYYGLPFDLHHETNNLMDSLGLNMSHLKKLAIRLGYSFKAYPFTENALTILPPPFIVITQKNEENHALVCFGRAKTDKHLLLADPSMGWCEMASQKSFSYIVKLLPPKNGGFIKTKGLNQILKLHLFLVATYKRTFVHLLTLSVVLGFLVLLTTISTQKLIDSKGLHSFKEQSLYILVLLSLLYAFQSLISLGFQKLLLNYQESLYHDYHKILFEKISSLKKSFLFSLKKGDLFAMLNDLKGTLAVHQILLQFFLVDFLLLLCYFIICAYYAFKIMLILLVFTLTAFLMIFRYSKSINPLFVTNREYSIKAENEFIAYGDQLMYGSFCGLSKVFSDQLSVSYQKYFQVKNTALNRLNVFKFQLNLFSHLACVLVIYILINDYKANTISTGTFTALFSISLLLMNMIVNLLKLPLTLKEYLPHLSRFVPLLTPDKIEQPKVQETDLLSFSLYNYTLLHPLNHQLLFKPISFHLKKNQLTVITGQNGVGKSLLLHSLFGFYARKKGIMCWNKQEIGQLEGKFKVAYLVQQPYIWDDTLLYNITFNHQTLEKDLNKFTCFLNLSHFQLKFKDGWQTKVGGSNLKLSVGETKLIGLLRELYKKPQLLILDEPTDSLSPASANDFLLLLEKLKGYTTILTVSHDQNIRTMAGQVVELQSI